MNWWFVLGSILLFLLALQLISGIVLSMYYVATPDYAYDSVRYVTDHVPFGGFVRGLHFFGASFIVVAALAHMARVVTFGSYKQPREVTWLTGVALLMIIMGFALTGYLLPWDQKAYWATTVTINIARSAPLVGEPIAAVMRGGSELGALTLLRWYADARLAAAGRTRRAHGGSRVPDAAARHFRADHAAARRGEAVLSVSRVTRHARRGGRFRLSHRAGGDRARSVGRRGRSVGCDLRSEAGMVLEAAAGIGETIRSCPNLTVLVTSREPLHVDGEWEVAVDPLREPEAVELFVQRALAVQLRLRRERRGRRDLPAARLPAARDRAGGGAREGSLAVGAARRLEQRLPLLTGGPARPRRQRTLRATIAWSHDLLTTAEQDLFARLAVFAGGWTLEAAEEICGADVDAIASLVDKSLLRRTGDRYWMLETIREFASEQLDQLADVGELRDRHAAWYVALGVRARPELRARGAPTGSTGSTRSTRTCGRPSSTCWRTGTRTVRCGCRGRSGCTGRHAVTGPRAGAI